MLYSAGDCPVCSFTGELLLIRDSASQRIFIYCPLCGCAWDKPPPPFTLDSIEGVEVFAPHGVAFPTWEEIVKAGMGGVIERNPDYLHWRSIMEDILAHEPDYGHKTNNG
jgi:hypothetical protein